jgi:hypothetical protein
MTHIQNKDSGAGISRPPPRRTVWRGVCELSGFVAAVATAGFEVATALVADLARRARAPFEDKSP